MEISVKSVQIRPTFARIPPTVTRAGPNRSSDSTPGWPCPADRLCPIMKRPAVSRELRKPRSGTRINLADLWVRVSAAPTPTPTTDMCSWAPGVPACPNPQSLGSPHPPPPVQPQPHPPHRNHNPHPRPYARLSQSRYRGPVSGPPRGPNGGRPRASRHSGLAALSVGQLDLHRPFIRA